MAVVESPFLQNVSFAEIPQGGTFVAGRKRRRINNDPYGGDGFVWDDCDEVSNAADTEPKIIDTTWSFEVGGLEPATFAPAHVAELPEQQRSSATRRLDQVRQHLLDLSIRRPVSTPVSSQSYGFSLDNIHMGIGNLYEWSSPQWNCPRNQNLLPSSNPDFDQEWQQFTRSVLFAPPPQPVPSFAISREIGYQEQMHPSSEAHTQNHESHAASDTSKTRVQPQSLADQRKAFRHPGWSNASASSEPWRGSAAYSQSKPTKISRELRVRFRLQPIALFEPLDTHCSSWSSLIARGRREIAAMA